MTTLQLEQLDYQRHAIDAVVNAFEGQTPETGDAIQARKPDQRFVCLELPLDTTRKWTLTQHLGQYLIAL